MQKAIKIIASIIGLLIILAIAAIICLVSYINPNDYKDKISAKVAAETGRELIIKGEIKWSFFPWLGLQLNQVSLSNAAGFGAQPFAQINQADAKVQLLPLLKGEVNVGTLGLDGLQLNLMKNAQGVTNWQDLTEHSKLTVSNDTTNENSAGKKSDGLKFNIEGIEITNSRISWQNQQKNQTIVISHLNLQSGRLSLTQAIPLTLQFTINSNQPALNGNFDLTGNISGDPTDKIYSVQKLKLTSTLNDKDFAGGKLNLALQGDVKVNLQNETLTIDALNAKMANLQIQGNLQGQQILSNLQLQGQVQIPTFNLKQFLAAVGHSLPARQNPTALTQVSASGTLMATDHSFKLSKLTARLDNTHINGNLAVTDFSKKALAFNLAVDQINLDNYMAAGSGGSSSATANNSGNNTASANSAAADKTLLPVETLRQLNLQGGLQIGSLHLNKLNASAVNLQIKAQNGLINLAPLSAKLYQGNYNGDITLDVRGKTPQITTRTTLSGIQIEPLTRDLVNITQLQMSGAGNINMNIATQGNTANAIINHLNGQGRLALNNGILKGINIPYWVTVGRALIDAKALPPMNQPKQTAFGNMTGTFNITNGLVRNNDLLIDAPSFQAKGSGTANLPTQYLDYKLVLQLLAPDAHKPQGDSIPVKLNGRFSNITPQPDVKDILKQQAKKQVQGRVTDELKKSLGDDTGQAVGDAVNSLVQQFMQ